MTITGYVTLGTADLAKSGVFYDELLTTIGATRFMEEENYFIAWSTGEDQPAISVTLPFIKESASVGNSTMVAMVMSSPEQVDAFYNKAISLGGEPVRVGLVSGLKVRKKDSMPDIFVIWMAIN